MDEQRLAELVNALEGRWRDHKGNLIVSEAEISKLVAEVRRLRAALDQCDMVMDTASVLGLPQSLPPAYRDSWAAAHEAARAALGPG